MLILYMDEMMAASASRMLTVVTWGTGAELMTSDVMSPSVTHKQTLEKSMFNVITASSLN